MVVETDLFDGILCSRVVDFGEVRGRRVEFRPHGLPAVLTTLMLLFGCAEKQDAEAKSLNECNPAKLEEVIGFQFIESIGDLHAVSSAIDYKNFKESCSGEFYAKAPIGGLRSRFPDVSVRHTIEYSISSESGVCISHFVTRSAGVYSACYK